MPANFGRFIIIFNYMALIFLGILSVLVGGGFYRAACRRGLTMRILPVCLLNACIVTKRKKDLSTFYTIRKIIYTSFMLGGGRPPLSEILGQQNPVGAKSPIFNRYSLVAPRP